ncbi:lysophospholipid acyltransferase family protein [Desulfomicrobium sp. ZS1]|uniref:lysophospholipid acyltransferase family protein n=1 Tax=Desulfomicrobium sp. ZS1 TaxID=2952228 RepID=UPI0020B26406|nr:lysophospholipid acyltransferase family protein [Desulfomicrobium sp. ZS1]UTF51873.1 lysophospholipid acyltransferase family protein [Desulfomicrobium sp. ZS1]
MVRVPVSPRFLGAVLAWFVRLWHLTLRVERINTAVFTDPQLRAKRPVIMLWHDEIFPLIPAHAGERMACVVSQSKDGEILAAALKSFGFMSVRGSSSRGGMRALIAAKRVMDEQGVGVIFTVDGPRGPRHKVKPGALFLARLAGSPIVPVRAVMSRAKVFHRAWDKFQLPWPFSRCTIIYGEPIVLPDPGDDPAEMQRQCEYLEQIMNSLGKNA